jgi:ribonuclease E
LNELATEMAAQEIVSALVLEQSIDNLAETAMSEIRQEVAAAEAEEAINEIVRELVETEAREPESSETVAPNGVNAEGEDKAQDDASATQDLVEPGSEPAPTDAALEIAGEGSDVVPPEEPAPNGATTAAQVDDGVGGVETAETAPATRPAERRTRRKAAETPEGSATAESAPTRRPATQRTRNKAADASDEEGSAAAKSPPARGRVTRRSPRKNTTVSGEDNNMTPAADEKPSARGRAARRSRASTAEATDPSRSAARRSPSSRRARVNGTGENSV